MSDAIGLSGDARFNEAAGMVDAAGIKLAEVGLAIQQAAEKLPSGHIQTGILLGFWVVLGALQKPILQQAVLLKKKAADNGGGGGGCGEAR